LAQAILARAALWARVPWAPWSAGIPQRLHRIASWPPENEALLAGNAQVVIFLTPSVLLQWPHHQRSSG